MQGGRKLSDDWRDTGIISGRKRFSEEDNNRVVLPNVHSIQTYHETETTGNTITQ